MSEPHPDEDLTPELPLTVDSPIWFPEMLVDNPTLKAYYAEHNIKCFGCCAAAETFKEGAKVHEGGPSGAFNAEKVVADLNELANKHPYKEETADDLSLRKKIIDLIFG